MNNKKNNPQELRKQINYLAKQKNEYEKLLTSTVDTLQRANKNTQFYIDLAELEAKTYKLNKEIIVFKINCYNNRGWLYRMLHKVKV